MLHIERIGWWAICEERGAPLIVKRVQPLELAEAAVFADLTVGLCLLGWLLPLGALVTASAVAPMAALGVRHRLSTVVAGGVCAAVVSMLIGGVGLAVNSAACAVLGAVIGLAERHHWSRARTLVFAAAVVWPVLAAAALAVLTLFASLRSLLLTQLENTWRGTSNVLDRIGLGGIASTGDGVVGWLVAHWWVAVAAGLLVALEAALFAAHVLTRSTLARLPPITSTTSSAIADGRPVEPVPVRVRDLSYWYPDAPEPALDSVSLDIDPATLVAVEGPNGSGKSTLARVLAGEPPSRGTVERPGAVGLGQPGGAAIVFQRPETQVLGMRVRDDVAWGVPPDRILDIDKELARVGLDGFADRDTGTLSGGELQRLAVAAALARRPALLISDETTAMIDEHGREQMVDLLRQLRDDGLAVVHVTHRRQETIAADHVIHLRHGRATDPPTESACASRERPVEAIDCGAQRSIEPLIKLRGVGHVYDGASPWAHRGLHGIDLDIRAGESLLVHGPNGSGKTTLAWVLAGLLSPTEGTATIDGSPLTDNLNRLGLSFQHARLQLERDTVIDDVRAASGVGADEAAAVLADMGLDPRSVGERSVDQLSGGQQRRVALAGLLAANPSVLILDEPFAGLDHAGRSDLIGILRGLQEQGTTLVLVSHDLEDVEGIVDHVVMLEKGRVRTDTRPPDTLEPVESGEKSTSRTRARAELRLFRLLPDTGPLHRTWAGTKLIALAALAAVLSLDPQWPMLAGGVAIVAAALIVGRVPRSAAPRLPRWIWVSLAATFVASVAAGGSPTVRVGSIGIGLGGAAHWLSATVLGVTILAAAALVSWTTPPSDLTAALQRLLRPLARLRLPIDQWTATIGLGLRSLPLLLDELRTLAAARRMRSAHAPQPPRHWRGRISQPMDLLAAASVTAARRAHEFAEAIHARGGAITTQSAPPRLTHRDAAVGAVIVVAVTCSLSLSRLFGG
jgi:energy-coupling factor transport system ATP-binding protein